MNDLNSELYDLESSVRSEKGKSSILENSIKNIAGDIEGNVRHQLKSAISYSKLVLSKMLEYDQLDHRITNLKVPSTTRLHKFVQEHNHSGFHISADDVKKWVLNMATVRHTMKDWVNFGGDGRFGAYEIDRVSRALVKSVDRRAKEDWDKGNDLPWRSSSPYSEHMASCENRVKYSAKYVKELNRYLKPFGVEASPTTMVYFEYLGLRKID